VVALVVIRPQKPDLEPAQGFATGQP
jgi:hypothetical protein